MLKLRERIARSLEDFIKIVSELENKEKTRGEWPLWFRGQGSAQWKLVPRFYRREYRKDDPKEEDDDNRELFAVRAPDLSDIKPTNNWDWYFVMQHYGAPTRLLDWTEGALHGLYFAIRHNKGYDDAAVWVLNPWKFNKKAVGEEEVIPPGEPGTRKEDRQRYEKWLRDRFAKGRWARWPAAIYPGYILRRISAQRSCFTIHGADQSGLETIAQELGIPLTKIVIPSWKVDSIRESLVTCGIDETTVFPDLEGLGRVFEICWSEPVEIKPHDKVYTRLAPSKIDKGGVGVFAIRRIKRGTKLFHGDCEEMVWVAKKDLPQRPRQIRKLYADFAVIKTDEKDKQTRYGCPLNFNRLTVSWYVNCSRDPNVRCDKDYNFLALRDIERGEELAVDYSTYSEEP
jgi:hypothetical protein